VAYHRRHDLAVIVVAGRLSEQFFDAFLKGLSRLVLRSEIALTYLGRKRV
jgi:hypothetical protein